MTKPVALSANSLIKTFGGLTATDNLSLSVETGEIHAVIGPNGQRLPHLPDEDYDGHSFCLGGQCQQL